MNAGRGIGGGFVECGCCQVWGWLVRMTNGRRAPGGGCVEAEMDGQAAMAAGGSNLMLLTPSLARVRRMWSADAIAAV